MKKNVLLFFTIMALCSLRLESRVFASNLSKPMNMSKSLCEQTQLLKNLPILQGGRVKPLFVHANESLSFIRGKTKVSVGQLHLYCMLSLDGKLKPPIATHIEHSSLLDFLKSSLKISTVHSSQKDFPLSRLSLYKDRLRSESIKAEENEQHSYKKAIDKLIMRVDTYDSIHEGQDWNFPLKWPLPSKLLSISPTLSPLDMENFTKHNDYFWPTLQFLKNQKAFSLEQFMNLLKGSKDHYLNHSSNTINVEYLYVSMRPFSVCIILSLLALIFISVKKTKWGLSFGLASLLVQILAVAMRVYISGRAPITNMYETVMFSGIGALFFSLAFVALKGKVLFLSAGLIYNLFTLFMINFANNMLPSAISPLVPVLRDNFWLSTHVTTIILSYSALALSWILANIALFKYKNMTRSQINQYHSIIMYCVQYGVSLLALGIILGGVWADYSWGRFWGWDPKETWSLIVFLIYTIILHGQKTQWIPKERFIPLMSLAFLSVMMAWFGVNYILASGLHSYGFSQGGTVFLISFFAAQIFYTCLITPKMSLKAKV